MNEENQNWELIRKQIELAKKFNKDFSKKTPLDVGQGVFGYEGFKKNGQGEIIDLLLNSNKNILGIMPTGGGKSACYQIPALIKDNLTMVISPLISLMKDQVESLLKNGIPNAFFYNSTLSEELKKEIISLIKENKIKILYLAPESLQSEEIKGVLQNSQIDLFVIDEAHCISTWGHNFRPDYLNLKNITSILNNPKILALTATATKEVEKDIKEQLGIKFKVIKSSFDRPLLNLLKLDVHDGIDKEKYLFDLLTILKGPTIIFARTQAETMNLAEFLHKRDIECKYYHGGLDSEERDRTQEAFMGGKCDIIIATKAFGMGIDKKDIRNVIHYNVPQSIEDYYQEIGRAGRDGDPANCIVLLSEGDIEKVKSLISSDWPEKIKVKNLIDHFINNSNKEIFLTLYSLTNLTGIKEIPIRLIIQRLEEENMLKKYGKIPYEIKLADRNDIGMSLQKINTKYKIDYEKMLSTSCFTGNKKIINLEQLSHESNVKYFRILEIFRKLNESNFLNYSIIKRRDMILIIGDLEKFDNSKITNVFERLLQNNIKKVDDLVNCLKSGACIRKGILNYFGEEYKDKCCEACSNCIEIEKIQLVIPELKKNYASNDEIKDFSPQNIGEGDNNEKIILKCLINDLEISKKDFGKILTGKLHPFSSKLKFKLNSYNILVGKDPEEIQNDVEQAMNDELVESSSDGNIRITKKGLKLFKHIKESPLTIITK